jgi:hypothetical protein
MQIETDDRVGIAAINERFDLRPLRSPVGGSEDQVVSAWITVHPREHHIANVHDRFLTEMFRCSQLCGELIDRLRHDEGAVGTRCGSLSHEIPGGGYILKVGKDLDGGIDLDFPPSKAAVPALVATRM